MNQTEQTPEQKRIKELEDELARLKGASKNLLRMKGRRKYTPVEEDARAELQRLVKQHSSITRRKVSLMNMSTDKKLRGADRKPTGVVIPCPLPFETVQQFKLLVDRCDKDCEGLESDMVKCLRGFRVYTEWLHHVHGVGPVVAAYLLASVDIERAQKPSALIRFAGLAIVNGAIERRTKGAKNAYNAELRTRIYQAFVAMRKNQTDRKAGVARTSKYLKIWADTKHRMLTTREGISKGKADSAGWHTAARVLLEDLYIMMRADAGLPVWVSWYAQARGHIHGGHRVDNPAELLSFEEALAMVGSGAAYVPETPVEALDSDGDGEEFSDAAE